MIKENIVKILEGKVEIEKLTEDNIAEYVQAKETIDSIQKFIVEPFKAYAIGLKKETIYSGNGIEMKVNTTNKNKKNSDKDIVNLLESTLITTTNNNHNEKRMYGVKRIQGDITMEANYLKELINVWKEISTGKKETTQLKYKSKDLKKIANEHSPRLSLINSTLYAKNTEYELTQDEVKLYIAGDIQIKLLKKNIITPFENAFKEEAIKNKTKPVFDNKPYGGLTVQVKSIPRKEVNYKTLSNNLQEIILMHTSKSEHTEYKNTNSYMNYELNEPKKYISINDLISTINKGKENTNTKIKQEINILYAPKKATILAIE